MAYIRKRATGKLDKFGNPTTSYQVVWREPVRDEFGAPTGKFKQTSETFPTERKAKAHLRKVENQLDAANGVNPSDAKLKANTPLATYARQYLDSLVGLIDPNTIEGYEKIYRTHLASEFGQRSVASITAAEVAAFRAQLLQPYVRRHGRAKPSTTPRTGLTTRSPKTVKQIIGTLKRLLDLAQDDQAIPANPVVSGRRRTTKRTGPQFKHRPLTANQVAAVFDWIATDHVMTREADNSSGPKGSTYVRQANPVYALAVLFAAHTGIRASELQGLQIQDVTLSDIPGTVGSIRITRTARRKRVKQEDGSPCATVQWVYGTPKSDASTDRVVALAPWLADELRDYMTEVHPFAGKKRLPNAPLFPGRRNRYVFDWAKPVCAAALYEHYLQPACKALGVLGHDVGSGRVGLM